MAEITNPGVAPALAAYRQAAARAEEPGAVSFGEVLEATLLGAVEAQRLGEQASLQAVAGQASLQEVVEAVTAAELSLEAVTAVRDRVIAAYQEIMRMPL